MKYQVKNSNGSLSDVTVLERENDLVYLQEGNLFYWFEASNLIEVEEKQPYQMTPIQYHNYIITNTMKKYNCSKAKAEMCHSKQDTDKKHLELLFKAIAEGNIIPVRVIDKLTKGQQYRLIHDNPVYFENNPYFDPEIRSKKLHGYYSIA
ncbi:hypothetical protein V7128_02060 [Neobacillus vireti]|uniref:hypothetical protein n=1 Tax=Neobacillus vireti TaxID=220686 RepID=UPI002FFEC6FA